jgi:hypothetical protein
VFVVPFARLEAYSAFARGSPSNLLLFWLGKLRFLFRTAHSLLVFLLVLVTNTYFYYDATLLAYVCKLLGQEVKKMMMNEYFERLTNYLLEKNPSLAYAQARTWVELLWEDFETTYARAGYEYRGKELTEKVVRQWIDRYGTTLHKFQTNNPKYKHLLNRDDYLKH